MAGAFVRDHGAPFVKVAGATNGTILTGATPSTAGNLLVARILYDNAAVSGKPIVSSIGKPAGETANWVFVGRANSTSTSLGALGYGEMWVIKTTVAWPANTSYTVTLDTATPVMKATSLREFSGLEAAVRGVVGTAYSTTTTAASASTSGTAPQVGDVALGFLWGSNVAAAQAGDNDTTAGSWSAADGVGSTGGSAATNNFGIGQYKVLTAATAQTYNNQAAMTAGNGVIVAILQATPPPTAPTTAPTAVAATEAVTVTTPPTLEGGAATYNLYQNGSLLSIGLPAANASNYGSVATIVTAASTWTVRGVNQGGTSTDSPASASVAANPAPPSFSLAPLYTGARVTITKRPYTAKYKVYRRVTSVGGAYTLVHTSASLATGGTYTFDDSGLVNGTAYDYVVSTEAQTPTVRESAQSSAASVTPSVIITLRPNTQVGTSGGWTINAGATLQNALSDNNDGTHADPLAGNSSTAGTMEFTLPSLPTGVRPETGGTFTLNLRHMLDSGGPGNDQLRLYKGGVLVATVTHLAGGSPGTGTGTFDNSLLGTDQQTDLTVQIDSTATGLTEILDVWVTLNGEAAGATTYNRTASDSAPVSADAATRQVNHIGHTAADSAPVSADAAAGTRILVRTASDSAPAYDGAGGVSTTEAWAGTNGSAWPGQWTTETYATPTGGITQQSGRGVIDTTGGGFAGYGGVLGVSIADVDVRVRFKYEVATGRFINLDVRYDSVAGTYYTVEIDPLNWIIYSTVANTSTVLRNLTPPSDPAADGLERWLRVQAIGNTIRYKVWLFTDPEPMAWTDSVVSSTITAAGKVRLDAYNPNVSTTTKVSFDDLTVTNLAAGAAGRVVTLGRSGADSAPATDAATRQATRSRTAADSAPATDAAIRSVVLFRIAFDTALRQFTDTFASLTDWTGSPNFGLYLGGVGSSDGAQAIGTYNQTFNADQFIEAKHIYQSVLTGVMVRVQGQPTSYATTNGYLFRYINSTSVGIYKVVNGVTTNLATGSAQARAGARFRLHAVGTTLTGYLNGVQVVQVTDATYPSGRLGLYTDLFQDSDWDDPILGDLAGTDVATQVRTFVRTSADSAPATDVATRQSTRARAAADSAPATDAATQIRSLPRTAADSAPATDSATSARSYPRTASDSAPATDAATQSRSLPRSASDSAPATDAATRLATRARTATDSAPATDAATRSASLARAGSDTAPATDSAIRAFTGSRTASDSALATDAATRSSVRSRTATEALTTSDAATRAVARTRTGADSAPATDAASQTRSVSRSGSDSAPASDLATRVLVLARSGLDSTSIGDLATRSLLLFRSATDSAPASDINQESAQHFRTASDSAPATDSAVGVVIPGLQFLNRFASDSAPAVDLATRVLQSLRTASDSAPATDAATQNKFKAGIAFDSAPATDAATQRIAYSRAGTDTAPASDAATRQANRARTASDTAPATDAATQNKFKAGIASDSAPATDVATRAVINKRSGSDSAPATDAATQSRRLPRTSADSAPVSDAAVRTIGKPRSASDSAPATDSATRQFRPARAASDAAPATDSATRSMLAKRSAADSAPVSDAAVKAISRVRSAADSAPSSDSASRSVWVVRSATDTAPASDTTSSWASLVRAASDSAPAVEVATQNTSTTAYADDSAPATDAASRLAIWFRSADDEAPADDSADRMLATSRSANDIAPADDSVVTLVPYLRYADDSAPATDSGYIIVLDRSVWRPPEVATLSTTTYRVSGVPGANEATVTFTFDQDVDAWSVRVNSHDAFSGITAASYDGSPVGGGVAVLTKDVLKIGDNDVAVYGRSVRDGTWSRPV